MLGKILSSLYVLGQFYMAESYCLPTCLFVSIYWKGEQLHSTFPFV